VLRAVLGTSGLTGVSSRISGIELSGLVFVVKDYVIAFSRVEIVVTIGV
jgi:hypothetical protein